MFRLKKIGFAMLSLLLFVMLLTSVRDCSGVGLHDDLKEFVKVIPADDIRNLTKYYYASDPAMRNSYTYLRDEGFRRIVSTLESLPFVQKVLAYLNDKGVILKDLASDLGSIVLTKKECTEIQGIRKYNI